MNNDAPVTLALPRFDFATPARVLSRREVAGEDLSPMVVRPDASPLGLTLVQRAKIRVDEEGAEAAAVTELAASPAELPTPTPPVEMRFDRPFLFVLRHDDSGAILAIGRVENPLTP